VNALPPHLESLGQDLERAAHRRVAALRRRRRVQAAVIALAGVLVATGAGLAAGGVDILSWVRSDDPAEVRYLVDTTRTYSGPAPRLVECESVRAADFTCTPIPSEASCPPSARSYPCAGPGPSQRIYWLHERVQKMPRVTRSDLHEVVDELERESGMPRDLATRFRDAVDGVGDDFFAKLDLLMRTGGGRTYHEGPQGKPIRPPDGVPLQIMCRGTSEVELRCENVAGVTDVPLGAPIYQLEPTADWVPADPPPSPREGWAEIEGFFGRPLTTDENLAFTLLFFVGGETGVDWEQLERAIERAERTSE
jgi:hypothetical protein